MYSSIFVVLMQGAGVGGAPLAGRRTVFAGTTPNRGKNRNNLQQPHIAKYVLF